jgi:hypothetical protein
MQISAACVRSEARNRELEGAAVQQDLRMAGVHFRSLLDFRGPLSGEHHDGAARVHGLRGNRPGSHLLLHAGT